MVVFGLGIERTGIDEFDSKLLVLNTGIDKDIAALF
jgi:type IV secretory pathway TrbL component